jgi:class 3 adenylate cyclase
MPDLPSGTVTFLFTDIEGSTALWEQDRQDDPVLFHHRSRRVVEAVSWSP